MRRRRLRLAALAVPALALALLIAWRGGRHRRSSGVGAGLRIRDRAVPAQSCAALGPSFRERLPSEGQVERSGRSIGLYLGKEHLGHVEKEVLLTYQADARPMRLRFCERTRPVTEETRRMVEWGRRKTEDAWTHCWRLDPPLEAAELQVTGKDGAPFRVIDSGSILVAERMQGTGGAPVREEVLVGHPWSWQEPQRSLVAVMRCYEGALRRLGGPVAGSVSVRLVRQDPGTVTLESVQATAPLGEGFAQCALQPEDFKHLLGPDEKQAVTAVYDLRPAAVRMDREDGDGVPLPGASCERARPPVCWHRDDLLPHEGPWTEASAQTVAECIVREGAVLRARRAGCPRVVVLYEPHTSPLQVRVCSTPMRWSRGTGDQVWDLGPVLKAAGERVLRLHMDPLER